MFQLKEYPRRCLDELAEYFRHIVAFQGVTDVPEKPALEETEGRGLTVEGPVLRVEGRGTRMGGTFKRSEAELVGAPGHCRGARGEGRGT